MPRPTDQDLDQLLSAGLTRAQIATTYGVTPATISRCIAEARAADPDFGRRSALGSRVAEILRQRADAYAEEYAATLLQIPLAAASKVLEALTIDYVDPKHVLAQAQLASNHALVPRLVDFLIQSGSLSAITSGDSRPTEDVDVEILRAKIKQAVDDAGT